MTRTIDELERDLHHAQQRHRMASEQFARHGLVADHETMRQASLQMEAINDEMDALCREKNRK